MMQKLFKIPFRWTEVMFLTFGVQVYGIREIAEVIGDTFGKKPIFEIVDEKAKDLIGDITGMKNKLYIQK